MTDSNTHPDEGGSAVEMASIKEVIHRIREGTFYDDYDWASGPALRVLDRLASSPSLLNREEVARIIDPEAWAARDRHPAGWESGEDADPILRPSLAKTDAILSRLTDPPIPEAGEGVQVPRKLLRDIFSDYMTSEKHHPQHVLIPVHPFEALREVFDNDSPTPERVELPGDELREPSLSSVWLQAEQNHRRYSDTGNRENDIRFLTLGLTGEAGEVANFVKKRWRDGDGHDEDIRKEIADVCAYAFMLANTMGMSPWDLMAVIADKQRVFVEKMQARAALQPSKEREA